MSAGKKVIVVMPAYNAERTLIQAIAVAARTRRLVIASHSIMAPTSS